MADYWKSQPKKFCGYCKCWIADNKPSIDFHERGKNHKENVAKKISEIKKKSLEKAKEEEKMSKEFAAMEEAAMKAYQEDLKRLGVKDESVCPSPAPKQQQQQQEGRKQKKEKRKKERETTSTETNEWVRGFSPEGYMYYYNTVSGESRWEKPEGFQDDPAESQTAAKWIKGQNEEGHIYYYNTQTGASSWEKPDGFVFGSNEYKPNRNRSEENPDEAESNIRNEGSENDLQKTKRNYRQSTESDEVAEGKLCKPKKLSPYGDWQEVQGQSTKKEDPAPAQKEPASKPPRTVKPYGQWEEIKEEKDPYEKVDLELPETEWDPLPVPDLQVPEENKMLFKEKTVSSLGSNEEGMAVFKKRKFENGKTRNIRQRLDEH